METTVRPGGVLPLDTIPAVRKSSMYPCVPGMGLRPFSPWQGDSLCREGNTNGPRRGIATATRASQSRTEGRGPSTETPFVDSFPSAMPFGATLQEFRMPSLKGVFVFANRTPGGVSAPRTAA
ncbi:hypothetical protein AAFF_G00199320 [Aldrovandia affinis]|uniref:Uncharacterized protein n=1 Tax=Aldrovandia affinis TaxID=143900 RepID=A0AAD7RL33_9TELE|nr:hypothetical protein AAFF_G00199320 [Aldrovandia affinis]